MALTDSTSILVVLATTGTGPALGAIPEYATPAEIERLTNRGFAYDHTGAGDYALTRAGWEAARHHAPHVIGAELHPGQPDYLAA